MPVAVNMPSRRQEAPEKDPLDTILKGLQIAGGIFGIKEGLTKAEDLKLQRERQAKLDSQTAENQAIENASKEAMAGKSGYQFVKDPATGKVSAVPIEGFKDEEKEGRKLSNEKLALELEQMKKGGGTKGLDEMLKRLQVQEHLRKAEEIEPAKALAAGYARRVEMADKILGSGEYDRTDPSSSLENALPGMFQSGGFKSQKQAEDNFLNAILRRESGANIAKEERASGEVQYFPRPGDTPEVLAQKAQNRAQVLAALRGEAGERALAKIPLAEMKQVERKNHGGGGGGATAVINYFNPAQPTAQASAVPADLQKAAQAELIRRRGLKEGLPKGK